MSTAQGVGVSGRWIYGLYSMGFAGRNSVGRWRPSKVRKYWHVIKAVM